MHDLLVLPTFFLNPHSFSTQPPQTYVLKDRKQTYFAQTYILRKARQIFAGLLLINPSMHLTHFFSVSSRNEDQNEDQNKVLCKPQRRELKEDWDVILSGLGNNFIWFRK